MNWLIDISSMLDLISDIMVLVVFYYSNDTAWLFIMLFTMLCPYYAVYTSLMNFLIERNKRVREHLTTSGVKLCCSELQNLFFILPTMLLVLIAYDVIYSTINIAVLPGLILISWIRGKNTIEPYETLLDSMINFTTGMHYIDIRGFRS